MSNAEVLRKTRRHEIRKSESSFKECLETFTGRSEGERSKEKDWPNELVSMDVRTRNRRDSKKSETLQRATKEGKL